MAKKVFMCPKHNCTISFETCLTRQFKTTALSSQRYIKHAFFPECQRCEKGIKIRETNSKLLKVIQKDNRLKARKKLNGNSHSTVHSA